MSEVGGVAGDRLKSFIDRIERLEEEKKAIADDIREVKAEAKGAGFAPKALNEIIKRRTWDAADLAEHDEIVTLYMAALGMLADTPLGQAAIKRTSQNSDQTTH